MKAWHLVAPDWASLDTIWRSPDPFVLWPVCEKNLLSYWLDEAVRRGVPSVSIEALDRPHMIRHWLDKRDLWSRSIELNARPESVEGKDCFQLCALPGSENHAPVLTPKELMQRWYDLQVESLSRRNERTVHLDHEFRPGIWFSPGVRAAPDAVFIPPCWVGHHASIGSGCRVGPHAFIGPGVFLDEDVEVKEAIVCEDTYVGSHTTLKRAAVQGGLLMDLDRGVGVEVLDEFMLASLGTTASKPPWKERIAAALAVVPLECVARLLNRGKPPVAASIRLSRAQRVFLHSYTSGPLCLRRSPWLRLVVAGKMRLVGVLPREEEDLASLHPSARSAIEKAPLGIFSLADLYHCHSPKQPDEWMHAAFQAGAPHGIGQGLALKSLLRIALTNPPD
jgi:hypothetical protein